MTCKSKVQKINNTLTGNKQKLFLKPPRSLPASVMKRKQSQEFVLRMPLKMGCLKIAKVELWQKNKKNKKFKANTKVALCKKWLRYRGTPECSIPKSLYTQKMYFTYCHFNQVFHLHCAEFNKRGCFSIRGVGGWLYSSAQFNSGLETVFVWFLRHYIQFESQMRWCLLSGLKIFSWGRSRRCCLANS